jgi:uncharacterized protein
MKMSMKVSTALVAVALAFGPASAHPWQAKPSFDCRYARTPDEITVCQTPDLAQMDVWLATTYSTVRDQLNASARLRFKQDELSWLAQRRQCGFDKDCIKQVYQSRIDELNAITAGLGLVGD